ncbi:MAG: hypothetical protein K5981_09330, partial [Clostridia bacterium]|nr:hypothetical protein [Clostridia bacterium]
MIMKRLLSVLLAAALIIGCMPLSVHAVQVPNATHISIYGQGYNAAADFEDPAGKYSYDAATHTLTLSGFTSDGQWSRPDVGDYDTETSIYANGSLVIALEGDNVIEMTKQGTYTELFCGIAVDGGDLTINGSGTLTITMHDATGNYLDANAGIFVARKYDSSQSAYCGGSLSINNAQVTVSCGSVVTKTWNDTYWSASGARYSYGLYADEIVYIANSTVEATAGDSRYYGYAVKAGSGLNVAGSTLTVNSDWVYDYESYCVYTSGCTTISDSLVTANISDSNDGAYGLYSGDDMTVTGGSQVMIQSAAQVTTHACGMYAADLIANNAQIDVDLGVTNGSDGVVVGYTGAVSGSKFNIAIGESTDAENVGMEIGSQGGSSSGFIANNCEFNVTVAPSRSQSESRSGKAIGMMVTYGDVDFIHCDIDLDVTSSASYKPYNAYGIYIENPNYYYPSRGGDLTIEGDSELDIEIGDVVNDAGGIYMSSNVLNGDDSKITIKTGEAKEATYSSTDGIDAKGFDLTGCELTIESGEANDGCRCIYVYDDTAEKTFDNCKVSLTANGASNYSSTGMYSGGRSPFKVKNGTDLSVEVKTSEATYGIESWGGLTIEDSTVTVTTADATQDSSYGINAPSDNRGVVASVKNSTVTVSAGKAGPNASWSASIGWSSYKGFDIDEDSTVTVTAGGNAGTQCIGMAVYDGEPINLAGTVTVKAGNVVGDDARGSFGLVTNLGSDATLTIPGTFTAQGYDRAITGGWTSGSFGNTNIEAENILAGVAYDGSD